MEFLKEYLSEELFKQVKEELDGTDVKLVDLSNGEYVNAKKFENSQKTVTRLKKQLAVAKDKDNDDDDNDDVNQGESVEAVKAQYEAQINSMKVESFVEQCIKESGAINVKSVRALLDIGADAKLNDKGEVDGVKDSIKSLVEADDSIHLFKQKDSKETQKQVRGYVAAEKNDDGDKAKPLTLGDAIANALNKNKE